MKITHICLCGPVTDNFSYQENLLPKYHMRIGYEVSVIASKFIWNTQGEITEDHRDVYYNEYGVKTIRIASTFKTTINSKLKKYKGLFDELTKEQPDIIFVHGVQFLDLFDVVRYCRNHSNVKVFVDNHADFSNSATTWLSKVFLHKLLWRFMAHSISPYTEKFYGVLPARVIFLEKIYNIPSNKIELLLMGADDDNVSNAILPSSIKSFREKFEVSESDFLIVTGGKIDDSKRQTLLLMEAVKEINNSRVKLILFGSIASNLNEEVQKLVDGTKIQYIGWQTTESSYSYFAAADLVVFPGRHSIYWEQVVALGIPMLVKYWEGTTHVDFGGNCIFLKEDSKEEILKNIKNLINNENKYKSMKLKANENIKEKFLYSNIARKSIN